MFDCSVHPTEFRPNQDITGIGISLAWTITAGLALCLVVANYFVAFRPDLDPFGPQVHDQRSKARVGSLFRPNPIDQQVLAWRLKKLRQVDHASLQAQSGSAARRERIRAALIQCMLTMSDFQLITGLSVLISGYSQLSSGISTYHWERILDLAWFSSITHLCCLTFLREFFYRNRKAQLWRIPGMITLVALLSVGLIPSASYADVGVKFPIQTENHTLSYNITLDYAKCFFERNEQGLRAMYYEVGGYYIEIKKQNAIISAVILLFGMTSRIWRLYEASTNVLLSTRVMLGRQVKQMLRYVLRTTESRSELLKGFVYRPMLASYLLFRMIIDILLSKLFEVWWLIIGLCWGLTSLYPNPESADHEWTFGQVIATMMLVAPVIALAETLLMTMYECQASAIAPSQEFAPAQQILETQDSSSVPQPRGSPLSKDDPDYDFYSHSSSFNIVVYIVMTVIAALSLFLIVFRGISRGNMSWKPFERLWAFSRTPNLLHLAYTMAFILCSLPVDNLTPQTWAYRVAAGILSFSFYSVMILAAFGIWSVDVYSFLAVPFGMYVVLFSVEYLLSKRRSAKTSLGLNSGSNVPLEAVTATSPTLSRSSADSRTSQSGHTSLNHLLRTNTGSGSDLLQPEDAGAGIGLMIPRRRWTSEI